MLIVINLYANNNINDIIKNPYVFNINYFKSLC